MSAPTTLPAHVAATHDGWTQEPHWAPYWTTVWKLTSPRGHTRFAKVAWKNRYPTLEQERDRTAWLAGRLPVASVIDCGADDDVEWLLTDALPGRDATHFTVEPERIVPILAQGLRTFHEVRPDDCPFDFRLDTALEHVRRRVASGEHDDPELFHEIHKHFTPQTALAWLEANRPDEEDVVVCHGDYCFPNILIEGDRAVGFVDLGELGIADRWWDLAVATWSCEWNVGLGYDALFYQSYGIEPDEERIAFYRLLYDLAS